MVILYPAYIYTTFKTWKAPLSWEEDKKNENFIVKCFVEQKFFPFTLTIIRISVEERTNYGVNMMWRMGYILNLCFMIDDDVVTFQVKSD